MKKGWVFGWLVLGVLLFGLGCGGKSKSQEWGSPGYEDYPPEPPVSNRILIQEVRIIDCHYDSWELRPGNCDGVVNPNEDIYLEIVLKNDSYYDFHNVFLQVSTDDFRVAIYCQKFAYGDIPAGNSKKGWDVSAYNTDPCNEYGSTVMHFRYLEMVEERQPVTFNVVIYADEGSWWDSFTIDVMKTGANLVFQKFAVVDKKGYPLTGNSNGLADPGEKVGLSIMIRNIGSSSTQKVVGRLKVVEGFSCASIEEQNLRFDKWLDAGNSSEAKYYFGAGAILENGAIVKIDAGCPVGKKVKFGLELSDMYGNSWYDEFSLYVSQEVSPYSFCGDGACSADEDCNSCFEDCGSCGQKGFAEACNSNEECLSQLCINWTSYGGKTTCSKFCSSDKDCYQSCCLFTISVDGQDRYICIDPQLAFKYYQTSCTPNCSGKQCGDDGCGGSCGSCGIYGCFKGKCAKFTEIEWGIIAQSGTGLYWMKEPSAEKFWNYSDAAKYCEELTWPPGVGGWRVPTIEELESLLLSQEVGKCYIDPIFQIPDSEHPDCSFCSPACDWFWSSTDYNPGTKWCVNFAEGYKSENNAVWGYADRVRCVKSVF